MADKEVSTGLVEQDLNVHQAEPHNTGIHAKLNWLRAGVLGANDGIVSTAGVLLGVVAAGAAPGAVMTAGIAAVSSGALSMALGEYVSVSTQRDTERELVAKERWELENLPEEEHDELVDILRSKGVSAETAEQVATELESHDAIAAHLDLELGLDADSLANPWAAAFSSAVAFILGALLPLLSVAFVATGQEIWAILLSTLLALGITGVVSARLSDTKMPIPIARLVGGGGLALAITFVVGWIFGTATV